MDSSSITMIFVLAALIGMSAYFSATETAFSTCNRIRLKNLANNGNKRAAEVIALSENYDRLLSTILIGNNIVNISSASLATVIFVEYFGNAGVTLSTVVMTILVLIFGEISPKSLAKEAPESFSMFAVPVLKVCIWILGPVNVLFMMWKRLLSKLFQTSEGRGMTEEELITMVEEAEQDGGIGQQESELIRSAIEFNDLDVTDVLTPRIHIEAISKDEDRDKIRQVFADTGYSRLPVYEESIDNVVGVLNEKDFFNLVYHNGSKVSEIVKPIIFAAPSMKISKLLKQLQINQTHMAVITDEYGGTMGIVTLEDILEELVGEIWDEHDQIVHDFVKISETEYEIDCGANLDKMLRLFHIHETFDMTTVSGWVTEQLGRIPVEGDRFCYGNLEILVLKTEHRRVALIHVEMKEENEGQIAL